MGKPIKPGANTIIPVKRALHLALVRKGLGRTWFTDIESHTVWRKRCSTLPTNETQSLPRPNTLHCSGRTSQSSSTDRSTPLFPAQMAPERITQLPKSHARSKHPTSSPSHADYPRKKPKNDTDARNYPHHDHEHLPVLDLEDVHPADVVRGSHASAQAQFFTRWKRLDMIKMHHEEQARRRNEEEVMRAQARRQAQAAGIAEQERRRKEAEFERARCPPQVVLVDSTPKLLGSNLSSLGASQSTPTGQEERDI